MTTESVLCALSGSPGIEWIAWEAPTGEPLVAARGRLVHERRLRDRASARTLVWRDPIAGGTLRVRAHVAGSRLSWPLEAWGRALAKLDVSARTPVEEPSERLHDVAHLVLRARLELEGGRPDGWIAAREALEQIEAEAAERGTSNQRTTLRTIVEREFANARAQSPDHALSELALDVDPKLELSRDPNVVGRLVRNLLVNALHASPRGARVHVAAFRRGSRVELRVRDDGRGMRSSTARVLAGHGEISARGRGVGLHSVRRCARRLRAELEFESRRGLGTSVIARWDDGARAAVWVGLPTAAWSRLQKSERAAGREIHAASPGHEPTGTIDPSDVVCGSSEVVVARGAPAAAQWLAAARRAGIPARILGSDERA